jgi:hypothetical protein
LDDIWGTLLELLLLDPDRNAEAIAAAYAGAADNERTTE